MPLIQGKTEKSVGKNIATEEKAGRPRKQAIAIALSVKAKAARKAHRTRQDAATCRYPR